MRSFEHSSAHTQHCVPWLRLLREGAKRRELQSKSHYLCVSLFHADLGHPTRFHLGSKQLQSSLEFL